MWTLSTQRRTNGRIDARHILKVARVGRAQDGRHAYRVLIARLRNLHSPRCGRLVNAAEYDHSAYTHTHDILLVED